MLDVVTIIPSDKTGVDIVTLDEMRRHLRLRPSNHALDPEIIELLDEVADKLHGQAGELNRTIFPTRLRRYMDRFPDLKTDAGAVVASLKGPILLPFPPLIGDVVLAIEDGDSPTTEVDPDTYVVKDGMLVPEIWPKAGVTWPSVTTGPRAVSVSYTAGYSTIPPKLKRMVKILAAHYLENPEGTINEPRQMMINRRVEFGMDDLRAALKVGNSLVDWDD